MYAQDTSVSVDRSQAEIKKLIDRNGGSKYLYFEEDCAWIVQFFMRERLVRLVLPRPDPEATAICRTKAGKLRTQIQRGAAFEQQSRQKWRALLLIIKAKLEAIDSGISSVEREFLADVVLPDGQRIGEWLAPQIETAYQHRLPPSPFLLTSPTIEAPQGRG